MIRKVLFKARFFLFSCLLAILAIGLSIVIGHSTAKAATTPSSDRAAMVVYSRCDPKGNTCMPHGGLYYVHNGVIQSVTKGVGIRFIHFGEKWPKVDNWLICGSSRAKMAAKAYLKTKQINAMQCHGNAIKGGPWRPWVWETYHYYGKGTPFGYLILFKNGKTDVHDGDFDSFQKGGSSGWDHNFKHVGGLGRLHYYHYENPNPNIGENHRTAKNPKSFQYGDHTTPKGGTIWAKRLP